MMAHLLQRAWHLDASFLGLTHDRRREDEEEEEKKRRRADGALGIQRKTKLPFTHPVLCDQE